MIKKIKYIDGLRFYRAVVVGINNLISRQDYLNQINVFPVPDGDTGTNMAYTLSTIANEIKSDYTKKTWSYRIFFELKTCRILTYKKNLIC